MSTAEQNDKWNSNSIFAAKIAGWNYFSANYDEDVRIAWRCGSTTDSKALSLFELGDIIAEHLECCKECS